MSTYLRTGVIKFKIKLSSINRHALSVNALCKGKNRSHQTQKIPACKLLIDWHTDCSLFGTAPINAITLISDRKTGSHTYTTKVDYWVFQLLIF